MEKNKALPLVSFEQAKKLKEIGFDWKVRCYYDLSFGLFNYEGTPNHNFNNGAETISAPTFALALMRFRVEKGWFGNVDVLENMDNKIRWFYDIKKVADFVGTDKNLRSFFYTYKEAETALLDMLIDMELEKKEASNAT